MLLYKYFRPYKKGTINGTIVEDLLARLLVRFTQPSQFNDPFDCRPRIKGYENPHYINEILQKEAAQCRNTRHFDTLSVEQRERAEGLIRDALKQKAEEHSLNPGKLEEELLTSMNRRLSETIGIICLSERPDSVLMWSHYADQHRGFAVGFDTDTDFFAKRHYEPPEIGELRKVTYSTSRPTVVVPTTDASPDVDMFFTKNCEWTYEREWRMLRLLKDGHPQPKAGIYLFPIPSDSICELIFGSRAAELQEESLKPTLQIIHSNPVLRNIRIRKADLSRDTYVLDIRDFDLHAKL
jgi:hypothetical protein